MMNLLRFCNRYLRALPWQLRLLVICVAIAGYAILGTLLLLPLVLFLAWCALGVIEHLFVGLGHALTRTGSLAPRPKTPWNRLVIEIRLLRVSISTHLRFRRTWFSTCWQELPDPDGPLPVPSHAFDRLLTETTGYNRVAERRTASRR